MILCVTERQTQTRWQWFMKSSVLILHAGCVLDTFKYFIYFFRTLILLCIETDCTFPPRGNVLSVCIFCPPVCEASCVKQHVLNAVLRFHSAHLNGVMWSVLQVEVQKELELLSGQQSNIETKMLALQRIG